MAERGRRRQLDCLGQHLEVLNNTSGHTVEPSQQVEPEPLFIFATHLSAHRRLLGEVKEELGRYGIRVFVAHDTIEMDAPWQKEIVDALNGCHSGAAFIHPDLHGSYYCMQEIGWMLGRGIPIARLMFGEAPKGLLGEIQGKELQNRPVNEIAATIMDWAPAHPSLVPNLAASLSDALDQSPSFKHTDLIWSRLTTIDVLSTEQIRRVVHAGETNGQVFRAGVGGYRGDAYRTVVGIRALEWGAEGELAKRAAVLKANDAPGYIVSPDDVDED